MPALTALARLGQVQMADAVPTDQRYVPTGVSGTTFYIPASELLEGVDPVRESARLGLEVGKIDKELAGIQDRLNNPSFVERAAPGDAQDGARRAPFWAKRFRFDCGRCGSGRG